MEACGILARTYEGRDWLYSLYGYHIGCRRLRMAPTIFRGGVVWPWPARYFHAWAPPFVVQKFHGHFHIAKVCVTGSNCHLILPHHSSPSIPASPGLLLLALPSFCAPPPPRPPFFLPFSSPLTNAKSTEIVCSSNLTPFAPSTAALASANVGYSISTYP